MLLMHWNTHISRPTLYLLDRRVFHSSKSHMNWIVGSSEVRKPHFRLRRKAVQLEPTEQIQAGEIKGVVEDPRLIAMITTAVLTVASRRVAVSLTFPQTGIGTAYLRRHQVDIYRLGLEAQHLMHAYLQDRHRLPILEDTVGDPGRAMMAQETVSRRVPVGKVAEVTMATIPEIALLTATVNPMAAEAATLTLISRAIPVTGPLAQRVVGVIMMTIEEGMIGIVEMTVAMNAVIDLTMEGEMATREHAAVAQSKIERGIVGENGIQ